jgi:hypothetical protein
MNLTDSYTVHFRNLSQFVVLIARTANGKHAQLFAYPSMIYGRRDGQHTIRGRRYLDPMTGKYEIQKSVTLGHAYVEFFGVTLTGESVALHVPSLNTPEGKNYFLLNDPEARAYLQNNQRIYAIKRLRQAGADAGLSIGLLEAKIATETPEVAALWQPIVPRPTTV